MDPGERAPLAMKLGEQGEMQRLRQAEVCAPPASEDRIARPSPVAVREQEAEAGREVFALSPPYAPSERVARTAPLAKQQVALASVEIETCANRNIFGSRGF